MEERIRRYETIFVVDASLPEEEIQQTVEKFLGWIREHATRVVAHVDWGIKDFAYPIQKKWKGHYHVVEFEAPASIVDELEQEYRRDERILRFLTVKLDKYAVEWNRRWRYKVRTANQGKVLVDEEPAEGLQPQNPVKA